MIKIKRKHASPVAPFDIINTAVMLIVLLAILYPLWFVCIASVSAPSEVSLGNVVLLPHGLTGDGYVRVFQNERVWSGYANAIYYTALYTAIGLFALLPCAYALSRRDVLLKPYITLFFTLTMFIGGGLIPSYLLIRGLHMLDTVWAIVLPGAMSVYNMIVGRTYFQTSIPYELQEAARIDGCDDYGIFLRVVLPLAKPIIAVLALYSTVGMWNSYFSALIYLNDSDRYPLQLVLREILVRQTAVSNNTTDIESAVAAAEQASITELVKYALMVVSSVPLLILYPFLQKYFVKGVMVGALKG